MKKLAIAAGTIVCILVIALVFLVTKGNTGEDGILNAFTGFKGQPAAGGAAEIGQAHYDGELLCTEGFETISYTDRDFNVEFANPFYAEDPACKVNVVFYDENHGFMMRSIGEGTNSEFFECYRTDDGTATWTRCAQDLWFEIDAENIVEMISPDGLVYMKTSPDLILGGNVTEISFSADGGDSWNNYIDEAIDELHLQIRGIIEELTLEERISQLLIPAIEELADEDEPDMTTADMVEENMPGGVLWCDAAAMSSWSFENQMQLAQDAMQEEMELPLLIVASYEKRPGTETGEEAETELPENIIDTEAPAPSETVYYATFDTAPGVDIENWGSGITVYDGDASAVGFGIFDISEEETDSLQAAVARTPEEAVDDFRQGADVLIVPSDFEEVRSAVFEAVSSGQLTELQINQALYRVLHAKLGGALQEEE